MAVIKIFNADGFTSLGIWGLNPATPINNVQNRAMRYFLGVHKFAPNAAIIGDMGWNSPILERKICILRLWNRLCNMPNHRMTKQIFLNDYYKCLNNWSSDIKQIFTELNLETAFTDLCPCDLDVATLKFKDLQNSLWKNEIAKKTN